MRFRGHPFLFLLVAWVLPVAQVQAQEARLDFESEACAAEGRLRDLLRARLGEDRLAPGGELLFRVRIDAVEEAEFLATIVVGEGPEAAGRVLRSATCDDLVDAVATVIALVLDPSAVLPEPPPPDEPATEAPEPEPVRAPEPTVERPPSPPDPPGPGPNLTASAAPEEPDSTERASRPRLVAHLGLTGSAGLFPALSLGGELRVGAGLGAWTIEATGAFDTTPASTVRGSQDVRMTGWTGGVLICLRLEPWFGCLQGLGGVLQGEVEGREDMPQTSVFGAAASRTGFLVPLGTDSPFYVMADLGLIVPFVRTRLIVDERVAWVSSPVAGRLDLGFGLELL